MKTKAESYIFYKHTCPPQAYDRAPQGARYIYIDADNTATTYIQVNKDPEKPAWIRLSEFFMDVFGPCIEDLDFVKLCIRTFENRKEMGTFYSDLEKLL